MINICMTIKMTVLLLTKLVQTPAVVNAHDETIHGSQVSLDLYIFCVLGLFIHHFLKSQAYQFKYKNFRNNSFCVVSVCWIYYNFMLCHLLSFNIVQFKKCSWVLFVYCGFLYLLAYFVPPHWQHIKLCNFFCAQ